MGGQTTVLAIAHPLAVDPEIEGRLHALEVHDDVHALPLLGHGKLMHIMTHGIVILWHQWRVGLEGIGNVSIDGRVEPLQFPTARHLYVLPSAHAVGGLEEIGEGQAGALHQFEFPHTVERPSAFRLGVQLEALCVVHAQLGQGAALRGEGQVVAVMGMRLMWVTVASCQGLEAAACLRSWAAVATDGWAQQRPRPTMNEQSNFLIGYDRC